MIGIKLLPLLLSLVFWSLDQTFAFYFPSRRLRSTSRICRHRLPIKMTYYPSPTETNKEIYNVPNSGWKSKQWNWGYAQGTGHDCAAICRRRWGNREDRQKLVQSLLDPVEFKASYPDSEVPFEEVKLILGLAWQRGRWDGSDGGPGGYGEVLSIMADARRYEDEDEVISALNFIEDVSKRFATISRNAEELKRMKCIANDVRGRHHHASKEEVFMDRREVAGLVLAAMGFVENGL